MDKKYNLNEELKKALGLAFEEAQTLKLKRVTVEGFMYYALGLYVTNKIDNVVLKNYFEKWDKGDMSKLMGRVRDAYNETKTDTFSLPSSYSPDSISGIPCSEKLEEVFDTAVEYKKKLSIMDPDDDEISLELVLFVILNNNSSLLDDIDGRFADPMILLNTIKVSDFAKNILNVGGKKPDDLDIKDIMQGPDLDKLIQKGLEENKKMTPEEMKRDDDEFEEYGQSEAVAGQSLDPNSTTPELDRFSTDMTRKAKEGKYDPVYGRDREIEQMIKILLCRKKNNVVLLGDAGCGKSSLVELLAQKIVKGDVPEALREKRICSLDLNGLVAGTKYRGQYEERLQNIIKEVCDNPSIILYIDEFHNLIGNGGSAGNGDGANILKPYLSSGSLRVIGSTTSSEYRQFIKDAALKRRFQNITITEPTVDETVEILKTIAPKYEEFHKVRYNISVLRACSEWAGRYIIERHFPDKAIDVLDQAGAMVKLTVVKDTTELEECEAKIKDLAEKKSKLVKAQNFEDAIKIRDEQQAEENKREKIKAEMEKASSLRSKWPEVTVDQIAEVVSGISKIPVENIKANDLSKLKTMKDELSARVIGQKEAVDTLILALQRNVLGLRDQTRPILSSLLVGPSGVGKTLICEELARTFFGSIDKLVKINMGEFTEEHTVSKLIGSTAGYIGYEDESILEKASSLKNFIILFDEIEKAHPKIFDIFLSLMDKGEVTLANGKKADFRDAIVIFTGNIGTKQIKQNGAGFGFSKVTTAEEKQKANEGIVKKAIEKTFRPEFINRLNSIVTFNELGQPELIKIFDLELSKLKTRLKAKGYTIKVTSALRNFIISKCDKNFGARDLQRGIQKYIEESICNELLNLPIEQINNIASISADIDKDSKVEITFAEKKPKKVKVEVETVETKKEEEN